jgi:hypothetical protein
MQSFALPPIVRSAGKLLGLPLLPAARGSSSPAYAPVAWASHVLCDKNMFAAGGPDEKPDAPTSS